MKKLMILAAAVAAMAACTKSEVVYDDNDTEIALAPVTKLATKVVYGVYKNSWYTNTEKFNVFAQHTKDNPGTEWKSIDLASSSTYLYDVTFAAKDYEVWGGETPYYWPKTGSLFFAGYSPADVTISESGNKPSYTFANTGDGSYLTIPGFVQGTYKYTPGAVASSFTRPEGYTMVDLMYFDVNSDTKSVNNVETGHPVIFNHALSWLTFNINCEAGYDGIFEITKITLKNIKDCATFNSGEGDGDNGMKRAAWNHHTIKNYGNIVLFDEKLNSEVAENVLDNASYFTIDDILIIPQSIPYWENADQNAEKVLEIEYTMKANSGEEYTAVAQVPAQISLTGGDGNNNDISQWLINKHYTYNITITGTKEILIRPSVNDWAPVDSSDIEVE